MKTGRIILACMLLLSIGFASCDNDNDGELYIDSKLFGVWMTKKVKMFDSDKYIEANNYQYKFLANGEVIITYVGHQPAMGAPIKPVKGTYSVAGDVVSIVRNGYETKYTYKVTNKELTLTYLDNDIYSSYWDPIEVYVFSLAWGDI